MAINAFLGPLPDGELGPTVDDGVRRLIARYGAKAVGEAVKRQAPSKRGRPKLKDWPELKPFFEEDARIWLDGGNPFLSRKNYSIAKAIADAKPGHSHPATMKRIDRRLNAEPYGRRWYMLVTAMELSRAQYSYKDYIRTLQALNECSPHKAWEGSLNLAAGFVADYTKWNGKPAEDLTMHQVEEGAKPINALAAPPTLGGLLGHLR